MTDNPKAKTQRGGKKPAKRASEPAVVEKDPIAYEIKRAREERDLSISELSRLTGISRPVLFGYEAGRTRPGVREIRLIAEATRTSPNRLVFGKEEPFEARKGVASFVKVASSSPAFAISASMVLLPLAASVLNEEEKVAFLTLLSSLVEARNKDAFRHIRAFTEVVGEAARTPEDLAAFSEIQKNSAKMQELQERIAKRAEELK